MARPQTLALVGLWAGATGLAVGMATAGVNLVASQVTEPNPVIIPGDLTETPEPEPTVTASAATGHAASPSEDEPSADDAEAHPEPSVTTSPASSAPHPRPGPPPSPSPSEDDAPDDEPTHSDEPDKESESPDETATAETRTVRVEGGQASFRFEGDTVELLWASPADGFTAKVVERRSDRIDLVFTSSHHESVIEARADPEEGHRIEVDEEPRDEDDD